MTALTCHGALSRNPDLRILCIENGAEWIPYLFNNLAHTYAKMPQMFDEDPVAAFKRCVYVSPFWEDDFAQVIDWIGEDHVVFGSDWPHPEGLADPLTLTDHISDLPTEYIRKIMGGNMIELLGVIGLETPVAAR